jgi:hypothetical protein
VEVLSAPEIIETLDERCELDGLPFMPEMLHYCGRRFQVFKSAHKTCDTIDRYVIRRMSAAVHLKDLRCDGAAHGGCQAGCLLFFKEAWLKRVPGPTQAADTLLPEPCAIPSAALARLNAATHAEPLDGDPRERYRCQATELLRATTVVRRRDRCNPAFYLRDLTSGNVSLGQFVFYGAKAVLNAFLLTFFKRRLPHLCGRATEKMPVSAANMQEGERVRVRSKAQIEQTLNAAGRNRGLFYDVEMLPFESGEYTILRRVKRILNEKSGHMMTFSIDCLILEGVVCGGMQSHCRMFCPRSIYPYWREAWLERATKTSCEPAAISLEHPCLPAK